MRVHERQRPLFADILRQHARVGSRIARVAFGAVAGNHHQRVGNHFVHCFLCIGKNQDPLGVAGTMQLVETFFGQVLAGVGKHEVAVADAEFRLPSRIE